MRLERWITFAASIATVTTFAILAAAVDPAAAQTPTPSATATLPPATATAVPPTATTVFSPTEVPTPAGSPLPTATFTATPGLPDLTVVMFVAPDPIVSGNLMTYTIRVMNLGGSPSGASDVLVPLPAGVALSFLGPGCLLAPPATVTCDVPALPPGGASSFTVSLIVTAGAGPLITTAIADATNAIGESNEANNLATLAAVVLPPVPPLGLPPPPPGDVMPPPPFDAVVPPPAPPAAPEPAPPAAMPAPQPSAPAQGSLWLQVQAQTPAYSVDGDLLWVASAGEWYYIVKQEDGWALAIWEGDTPEMSVWIQIDARVQQATSDRPAPMGQVWLAVSEPTQTFSPSMAPMWMAAPGEWYLVIQTDGDWVLAVWEFDPPEAAVWIQVDGRVRLARA